MTIEYKDSKRITAVSSDWTADVTSNITWSTTGKVGWDISGTTISRTGSDGWSTSKIQSTDTFTVGDGAFMIEFSGNEGSTMLGFNKGTLGYYYGSGSPQNSADFSIYLAGGSRVEVYESGTKNYDSGGSRNANDKFRIEVSNSGVVKYYLQEGGTGSFDLKHTSSSTASGTYFIQANAYANTSEATVHSKTVNTAVAKPSNVQDNSILVEKDNARRYWGTNKVTTEEVYDYTTAPSTSNKLTGTPIGYSADAVGVELVSSTFAGRYIKTGKWMLKRVGTLGSNAFMKVQDSSGTVKATSAGVAASGIGTSAFEYVTFTLPTAVELANGDRVYVEYTGADTSGDYLAIGEKHPSTTPTGWEFTVYNVRDVNGNNPSGVWGDDGYPTALVPTATFDLAPASNVTSDSITWTMTPTLEYDLSTSAGWTTTGSNCSVNTSGQYLEGSSSTNDDRATKALGITLSDTKFVVRQKMELTDVTTGGNGQLYFGYTDKDNSTTVLGNRDAIGITIRTGADFLQSYALNQAWQSSATLTTTPTETTYYLEIIRDSATSHTLNLYSDSNYSVLIETKTNTISSSINGLDHITIGGWDNNASGNITARFSNIEIYNGVNTVN